MFIMIEAKSDSGKYQELLQTLQTLQPTFQKNKKRSEFDIYTDIVGDEVLLILIKLPSKHDLQKQIFIDSIKILIGALENLCSAVKVKTLELKQSGGIHLLKQSRSSQVKY